MGRLKAAPTYGLDALDDRERRAGEQVDGIAVGVEGELPLEVEVEVEVAHHQLSDAPVVGAPAREESEKFAKEALAIDGNNVQANQTLGLLYANSVGAGRSQDIKTAILHLERAAAGTTGTDLQTQFTLGQMYLRNSEPQKAVQAFTASFRPLPGLNLGWLEASILIGSPVRGLRPVDALRCDTRKVPNPTSRTSSPRASNSTN